MDAAGRRFNTPQFPADILPVGRESPKAENLLITKGKVLHFSLPKAENILKISQLRETPKEVSGFSLQKAENILKINKLYEMPKCELEMTEPCRRIEHHDPAF